MKGKIELTNERLTAKHVEERLRDSKVDIVPGSLRFGVAGSSPGTFATVMAELAGGDALKGVVGFRPTFQNDNRLSFQTYLEWNVVPAKTASVAALKKLAAERPELRGRLVPLLKDAACGEKWKNEDGSFKGKPGEAFDNCKKFMTECRDDVDDPDALCAWIGRKHGKIAGPAGKTAAANPTSLAAQAQVWFDGLVSAVAEAIRDEIPRTELEIDVKRVFLSAAFKVSRWDRGSRENCGFEMSFDPDDGKLGLDIPKRGRYSNAMSAYFMTPVRQIALDFAKLALSACRS